jgi:protein-S-isoprenylcysteine O-methyltransferase Ste14
LGKGGVSKVAEATDTSKPMKKLFWGATLSSLFGLVLALVCLRQWGSADPWSRLDRFSGGFLALFALLIIAQTLTFNRSALRAKEVAREALGLSYDPGLLRWGTLVGTAELTVILDYGHWHLVPALEQRSLQSIGLGLATLAAAWLIWTDIWLSRHFSSEAAARHLMSGGPYHFVRHPRYAGFVASKLASPLVFASVLGWLFLVIWATLLLRRMRREEAHLRELFGADYEAYAARTARLLPGIY